MASLDPRKNESITNQPNYLMTAVTTMIIASLTASIQSGNWSITQYAILAIFWIIPAAYKQIKRVIDSWTEKKSSPELSKSPTT